MKRRTQRDGMMRGLSAAAAAVGAAFLAACSGGGGSARTLGPSDFRAAVRQPTEPARLAPMVAADGGQAGQGASSGAPVAGAPPEADVLEVTASVGPPPADAGEQPDGSGGGSGAAANGTAAAQHSDPVVIDALVGQINGKPVYASDVLDEITIMRAMTHTEEGRRRSLDEWLQIIAPKIRDELIHRINNQLILAEARSSLSDTQKQGLVHVLGKIRKSLVSKWGGAEQLADERLRQSGKGMSLSKAAKSTLDDELVAYQLHRRIDPLVNVTQRQVRIQYDRDYDHYNPPATASFRMIRVPSDDKQDIEKLSGLFTSGKTFDEVAASDASRAQGVRVIEFSSKFHGDYAAQEHCSTPELNKMAAALHVRGTVGPKPDGLGHIVWLHLDSIDRPPATSFYDAQLEIYNRLRTERRNEQIDRYLSRLREAGSFTDFAQMMRRLIEIASQRYWYYVAQDG